MKNFSSDAFKQVCMLPPVAPPNKKQMDLRPPNTIKGGLYDEHNTGFDTSATFSMNAHSAEREFVQNLYDQVMMSNLKNGKPSTEGIMLTEGTREFEGIQQDVIVFHTEKHKLAEIIECTEDDDEEVTYFVNFGTCITNWEQLFMYGKSGKRDVGMMMIGCYGEGGKRAIGWLLNNGYHVTYECPVFYKNMHSEFRRYRCGVKGKKNELRIYEDRLEFEEWMFPGDQHRFVLRVSKEDNNEVRGNALDRHLLCATKNIQVEDPVDQNDTGRIYLEKKIRGMICVNHFKVMHRQPHYCLYAYDIFGKLVPRDRDNLKTDDFISHVAEIWSKYITTDETYAKCFFESVVMRRGTFANEIFVEWRAIPYLSNKAMDLLKSMFLAKYPNTVVCRASDFEYASTALACDILSMHDLQMSFFCKIRRDFATVYHVQEKNALDKSKDTIGADESTTEAIIARITAPMCNIVYKHLPNGLAVFAYDKETNTLSINFDQLNKCCDSSDSKIAYVAFDVLGCILPKDKHDITHLVKEIKKLKVEEKVEVPVVIDIDLDEEEDEHPTPPPPKKKTKTSPSEFEGYEKVDLNNFVLLRKK